MHVFVSYSREDSEVALQFVSDLQRQDVNVWLDQKSQRGGDDWIKAIQGAIDGCSHFVLLMSPSSIASNIVRDEWTYARKVGASIVPVMLRHCEPPFPLHTVNWIDLENDYDGGIKEVVRALDTPGGAQGNRKRLGDWSQWLRSKLRRFGHLTKRTAVGLTGMAVLIVLGYLGYDLMKGVISPCETIYEQTATRLGTKVEFLQAKGEIHVGKKQLQVLPQAAQVMALNLKTCCIVLDEGKLDAEQFLQCRTAAQNYESNIDSAVEKVVEVAKLQRSNETEAYARSLRELRETLERATEVPTPLSQVTNSIDAIKSANRPDRNASPPAKSASHGKGGQNGSISFQWDGETRGYWSVQQADQYGDYKKVADTEYLRRGERQVVELAPGEYRVDMSWDRGFKPQDVRVKVGEDVSIQPVFGTVTFVWDGETKDYWRVQQADQYGDYKKVADTEYLRRGERQVVELAPGEYRVDMSWDRGFKPQDVRVKVGEDVSIQPVFGTVTFVWDGETKGYWRVQQADQYGDYKKVADTEYLRRGERQVVELAPGEYRVDMSWDRGFKPQDVRVKVGEDVSIQPVFGTVTFVWDGETRDYWRVQQADQYGDYKKVADTEYLRRGERQVVELAPGEYRVDMSWDRGFKPQDVRVKVGEDVSIQPVFGTVTFVWDGETKDYWRVSQADQYGDYKKVADTEYLRRGERQVVELAPGEYRVKRSAKRARPRDVSVNIGKDVLVTE